MVNAIITGLPRSGTTLLCHLLNKLPDTVALHEPLHTAGLKNSSTADIIDVIQRFFLSQREQILSTGTAISKVMGSRVPSNPLSDELKDGSRIPLIDGRTMAVDNVRSEGFDLYIKHPAMFSAMLPELSQHFQCFVGIRNPLAVLLSWATTEMPVSRGRAPAAEMIDPSLARRLDAIDDALDRQIVLMDFFFRRYSESRNLTLIRYEDVIATSGRAISSINAKAESLNEILASRNQRAVSRDGFALRIAERLLKSSNACWQFYSPNDVEALLSNAQR